jgi:hypothetical protein
MSTRAKIVLGICGSILLGALGSGFWDLFLRDAFIWVGHGLLTIITLGIGSVRDGFYAEISKGRTDRVGIYLVTFSFVFLGALWGLFMSSLKPYSFVRAQMTSKQERLVNWCATASILMLTCLFFFRSLAIGYESSAIDHFEQSFAICLPLMSGKERDEIRSEFSRIQKRDHYVSVLNKLRDKAQQNGMTLPRFNIW